MEFWSQKIQISIFGLESFRINNCDNIFCVVWSEQKTLDIVKISSRYREELIFKLKESKVMFMVCCHGRHVGGGQLKVETKLFLWFVFVFVDWSGISKHEANIMPATIEVHDQA